MNHPHLYDASEGSAPLPEQFDFVERRDADRKAFRSFIRGTIFGATVVAALAWSLFQYVGM